MSIHVANDRSTRFGIRLMLLACAVLIGMTAAPLYAQDTAPAAPAVQVSQPDAAPPTLGLKPGEEILVASDKPMAPVKVTAVHPGSMVLADTPIHSRHSGLSNGYVDAIAAGLLLIPLDKSLGKVIPRSDPNNLDGPTRAINSLGTPTALLPIIGGLYVTGDKSTAKDALSALATVTVMAEGMKVLAGRERPLVGNQHGDFKGPSLGHGRESFPSGHTAAAFAVASVLAAHHPQQKWLYYGVASAVGLARIRSSMHFPSDVLVGAGLGMYAGRQAVNREDGLLSIRF